jgi:hypothetical protein
VNRLEEKNMKILSLTIGVCFLIAGISIVACNYLYLWMNYGNRKRNINNFNSLIPLFGALFLLVGSFMLLIKFRIYFLLVFVLDPGTLILLLSMPKLIRDLIKSRR